MQVMSQFVDKETNVLKIDTPRPDGKGWQRAHAEISTEDTELGDSWCEEVSSGANYILEETWVKANDPHYDAKVWPIAHPYGTGSELSEVGAGSPQAHARNRTTSIQSFFRRTARWAFWKATDTPPIVRQLWRRAADFKCVGQWETWLLDLCDHL